ncbi:MAG: uracil-DNA glycosylase [bacterium]|nr:uracil-DNA glycosylase [bacterium]
MNDKVSKIAKLTEEILNLEDSTLILERKNQGYLPVIGEGSLKSKIMFIGEAPGINEAKTGRPFIGKSGKLLDELLLSANIKREDVYITNIVKDKPPKNRDPFPSEIALYAPYLDRQLEIIKPKIIATLGRFSMEYIMSRYGLENEVNSISSLHGAVFETKMKYGEVKIIFLYHPAAAIYNQHLKETLYSDIQILKSLL